MGKEINFFVQKNIGDKMVLKNILTLPSFYKNRVDKVNAVTISNVNIDSNGICSCISNNKHRTVIKFLDDIVNAESKILVDCDCESFTFEFMNSINKANGLLYMNKYVNLAAKKRNIYSHLTGCKHLIKFAQFLFHKSHLLEKEFKKSKGENLG